MKLHDVITRSPLGTIILSAALVTGITNVHAAEKPVRLKMASVASSTLPLVGSLGKNVSDTIRDISGGSLQLRWSEPGALVPPFEIFDAVANGSVDVGWSNAGYWVGKDPAFAMFAAVPFGPEAPEYLAWMYYGGGKELMQKLYANYNIHALPCGVWSPEGGGWFRKEIKSVEDLKGLKMRILGLGSRTVEKLGVSTQLLASGDIYNALDLGTIDATEYSMPAIDLQLGFHDVAKYYYFPGWHQQSTLSDLLINQDVWDDLSDTHKSQIRVACGDNFRKGLAQGEFLQAEAIEKLKDQNVEIRRWPEEVQVALNDAWHEVVEELETESDSFANIWSSYSAFRDQYEDWQELGYLK